MIKELHGRKEIVQHSDNSDFRLYINREHEDYPPHWHTDLEIIMCLENIYTVVLEDHPYELRPNDIIIIPSGELHELRSPRTGKRLIFQISNSILNEVNGFDSIYNKFYPCALYTGCDPDSCYPRLVHLLMDIIKEFQQAEPLYQASIHALIISFFVEAGRSRLNHPDTLTSVTKKKQKAYIDTFFNLCTYMNEHCTEELSLEMLASMTGFSQSHFIRLFKEFAGVSYYEYLTKRRIIHAEIMLNDPDYSIADIAMQSGFNSLATFNRVFKTNHHCTPSEYRKRFDGSLLP